MNSCCVNPVEVIAEDKHKPAEQCCLVTDITLAPAQAECPVSRTLSRKVQKRTVEHLLKPEKVSSIQSVQYYYCTRARIKEELASTGKSTAPLQIAKEVKAGNCACDIKNPKGECCLGDVNSYVKSLHLTDTPS